MRVTVDIDWHRPLWWYRLGRWIRERPCRRAGGHDWKPVKNDGTLWFLGFVPTHSCARCGTTSREPAPTTFEFSDRLDPGTVHSRDCAIAQVGARHGCTCGGNVT